jgi:Holliday junction resolvase-like predicted endonuclease
MKESAIEQSVCTYAKKMGFLALKINSTSRMGLPDRIFIGEKKIFFIEFKKKDKKPTKIQKYFLNVLSEKGFSTYIIDNVSAGKEAINKES